MGNILDATQVQQENGDSCSWSKQKRLHNDSYSGSRESIGYEGEVSWDKSERISRANCKRHTGASNRERSVGKIIRSLIRDYCDQKVKKQEEIERSQQELSLIESKLNELGFLLEEFEKQ